MKNISAWAIRHPVSPIVLFVVLLFMGTVAFMRLPVTLNPDIAFPVVLVQVVQPGASPQELAQMRMMMSRPQTHSECITPEQAADPVQRMMNQGGDPHACQFSQSVFANGVIRVHARSVSPGV